MEKELHLCVVMSDSYFDIYKQIFHKTLPMEFGSVNILHIRDLDSEPGAVGEDAFKIMVFQYNPHTEHQSPYIVATWALQCSQKNIDFFDRQIMRRAESLLLTKEEWDTKQARGDKVPGYWFSHRKEEQTHLDGDGCVVNTAILESKLGQELKIATLPETYTIDSEGGSSPEECVLYQSAGVARGIQEKATSLIKTFKYIRGKIDGSLD